MEDLVEVIQKHRPQFEAGQYENGVMVVSPYWFCNNCPWQMDITKPDTEQDIHLAQAITAAGFKKVK